jgi:hypothetical protein
VNHTAAGRNARQKAARVVAEWRVEVTAVPPTPAEYELEPLVRRLLRRHAGSGRLSL